MGEHDSGLPGRTRDPDATVIIPRTIAPSDAPTDVISAVPGIGRDQPWDTSAVTAEHPIVPPSDDTGAAVARHGSMMAAASIVSRVTGYLRTAAIGAAIGAKAVADDYNTANVLPGMVYELLLGGVLASVVVPLIVRARSRDADHGEAYAQRLLTLASVFLAGATTVAVLCAPLFTRLLAGDAAPADARLITVLSYLMLPMIFFYGMAALFAAVLNTRGHFAAPALTPILNNLVVIGMAGVFIALPHTELTAQSLSNAQIALLGLGTTLGIVIQAFGLWPALRRFGFRWKWRWDFRQLHLRELGRISTWMLVYVIVSQAAVVVIIRIANLARTEAAANGLNVPGPTIFNNAYLIFMMAHGIVAVSIITVLMPRMSAAAAEHRHDDLIHQISLGTRLTAVVLLPATLGYLVLGRPLAVTLFEWGNYPHEQAIQTGWVIAVAGLGLVPFAISQIQLFAFYAMPDTKTPALINLPVVAVRIGLDVIAYLVLPLVLVAAGLMGGNVISFVAAAAIGYWLLHRRIGSLGLSRVMATLGRLTLAAIIGAIPAAVVVFVLIESMGDDKFASAIQLIAGGLVLVLGYVGAALLLRVHEVRELGKMLRSRVGR